MDIDPFDDDDAVGEIYDPSSAVTFSEFAAGLKGVYLGIGNRVDAIGVAHCAADALKAEYMTRPLITDADDVRSAFELGIGHIHASMQLADDGQHVASRRMLEWGLAFLQEASPWVNFSLGLLETDMENGSDGPALPRPRADRDDDERGKWAIDG